MPDRYIDGLSPTALRNMTTEELLRYAKDSDSSLALELARRLETVFRPGKVDAAQGVTHVR